MRIKENNIILADFMGWETIDDKYYITPHFKNLNESKTTRVWQIKDLKFHNSDEWLKPVVNKVEDMGVFITFLPDENTAEIRYKDRELTVYDDVSLYKVIVEAVIFILFCNGKGLPKLTADYIESLPIDTVFDKGAGVYGYLGDQRVKWVAKRIKQGWTIIYDDYYKFTYEQIADFETLIDKDGANYQLIMQLINCEAAALKNYANLKRKPYQREKGII
jgi:hypothetical protein